MKMDTYNTIAAPAVGEYKEKGSKFIAYAYFVQSEEEIKEKVELLKKEHFKACHHCYAWRLGLGQDSYRANDDGEPSGTAGRPILGQIDSFGLTNLLIVIVRYYGGTKLGTSGLITAYKTAAMDALQQAEIEERIVETILTITIDYTLLNDLMQYLKSQEIAILNTEYSANQVSLQLSVRNSLLAAVEEQVNDWEGAELEVQMTND
jgi:uncharacterized YigZ family protein